MSKAERWTEPGKGWVQVAMGKPGRERWPCGLEMFAWVLKGSLCSPAVS